MLHKIVPPFLHTVYRHVFLKGPCGHSNIPKSPQAFTSIGVYRKKARAFLLKGPCGHSNIPKSPQIFTSTGVYRKKHAAFLRKGPCGHSNIPKSPQMIASTGAYRKTARGLWLPQPAGAGSPLREGAIVCKGKKSSDVRRIRSTSTRPCTQPKSKRHSRPQSAPAAKPP